LVSVLPCFSFWLLHPNPKIFCESVVYIFLHHTVAAAHFKLFGLLLLRKSWVKNSGRKKKTPPLKREIIGEMQAVFLVACIGAWPVGLYRAGLPTGLFWSLSEMGLSWWMVILQVYAGIIAVDAITYWKHRLLHTRLFFPFHKFHHSDVNTNYGEVSSIWDKICDR